MRKPSKHFTYSTLILVVLAGIILLKLSKTPIQTFSKVEHKPPTVTLWFGGDIMLSRNVDAAVEKSGNYNLPFEKIADQVKSADIAFANLESPFNDVGPHSVDGSLVFDADPKSIAGLNSAGFDIVSTANNHALDQGQKGLNFTLNWLAQNNILSLGTGANCHDGRIISRNGMKFGFLGYSYTAYNSGSQDLPDPNVCDATDLNQLKKDITKLRPKVDFLIVSTHMGVEYTRTPSEAQVKFAHTAIDAGADLMIGNHPHWVQTIEQYHDKWIFYAMGNLVFDQMFSQDTREGLTAKITFENKQIKNITLSPVIIDDYCCPRWANTDETKTILGKIDLTSTNLFSTIR